jgi:hypothetical protein
MKGRPTPAATKLVGCSPAVTGAGLTKSKRLHCHMFHSQKGYTPPYKISSKSTNRLKFVRGFLCTHLRSWYVSHFGIVEATGLKKCGVEVTFNGITRLPNFMKIHWSVKKLLGGTYWYATDFISLLSFSTKWKQANKPQTYLPVVINAGSD